MFGEGQLIHLTDLGGSDAFVFSSFLGPTKEFIKYCTNLNKLYHSFKMSLCNFYVLVTKVIYERFYLENIWQLSLIGEKNKRIQQLVYGRDMQFITSSASTGPTGDLRVHLQLGQSKRFQVFLNHEKQWRTFSFNLNRELKMKFWYFGQLELQFRQFQSLSFSKYKK
ncbi:Hypothetical_protein [Hexamita inflata]|uniref:Hypothetical_protein n=1 Tax=Hexamita inflata TaxID=28002 RepID=A0AA86Q5U2_9EUKA|nr:Hypothetical protein HINF_LOCUS40579 [Hexamita inflata]